MREALKNEPSFAQRFVTYLLTRTSRVEEDLIDQLFNSSERRLARLLLLLAHSSFERGIHGKAGLATFERGSAQPHLHANATQR